MALYPMLATNWYVSYEGLDLSSDILVNAQPALRHFLATA